MAIHYPFSPALLDALPEELAELYRGLEDTLLEEICSRFRIADQLNEVTVADIKALRSHGIPLDEIKRAIAKTNKISMEKLDKLFDDVVARNQAYYTSVIDLAHVTKPDRLVDAVAIEAIRRQTKGELRNLTQSMGFVAQNGPYKILMEPAKAYQWALDQAVMQVESGAINYNQAIIKEIKDLAGKGVCVVRDKNGKLIKNRVKWQSGHIDHLDVSVRRAVMSGVNALNQKYREQSMDYLETDLVETTAHMGARNTGSGHFNHESWQGGIYHWRKYGNKHRGKYPDFEEACGMGQGGGIGGWNCRHSYFSYVDGVMEPSYSKDELDKMKAENNKFEFEGKEYNSYSATQQQRSIEREIRKQTRLLTGYKAAGQTTDEQNTKILLKQLRKEYKDFSAAAGLPEQRERMKVLYP